MSWTVAAVMSRDVVTVDRFASFKTCLRLMRLHGVGALPVTSRGKVIGIVTVTDLMLKEFRPPARERYERPPAESTKGGGSTAAGLMTRSVITIGPDAPVASAVRLMFEHQVNRLPVVDGGGRLIGLISRSDVLRVFLRSDLAIRNEIQSAVFGGRLKPQVRDGIVTLEGEVEGGPVTEVLLRLVASVPGVLGVHNHLKVRQAQHA